MKSRLSSLELFGYKTFANNTLFEFPSMVTAIVGPNGSGKSNIADSIRWVLGEQSYSLLRAKKTEDMIFSGSEQRARAGLASVSITFNNEDSWLPIDYSEVVLTRRAYRDGQNEYLINNQRVRLKDFHELLAQTGLADRTYTIIGQGLVDLALSIKPDERRKLFEEAAGIGLYSARKEEAIKRLDSTKRNLDRILDILSEIKPRLRSLERQAAKVAEYKRIQSDLKLHLKDWYGYYFYKAQNDVILAQQQFSERERHIIDVRTRQGEKELQIEKLYQTLIEKREQVNSLHSLSSDIHKEIEEIGKVLAVFGERLSSSLSLKNQLKLDLDNLLEKVKSKKISNLSAKEEYVQLKKDFDNVNNEYQIATKEYSEWNKRKLAVEHSLKQIREEMIVPQTTLFKLQARKSDYQERKADLENSINSLGLSIQKLQTEMDDLTNQERLVEENQAVILTQREKIDEHIHQKAQELIRLEGKVEKNNQTLSTLKIEKTHLSVKLDMINQSENALTNFSEGAKVILQTYQESPKSFYLSTITKHIIVPEEYELAISSSLGEIIDLLLIKGKKISPTTIDEFEERTKERLAFISEESIPNQDIWKLPLNIIGVIGKANELVSFDGTFRKTIESILEKIVVVKSKAVAIQLIELMPDSYKIATLQGEVFYKNGVVSIGKLTTSSKISTNREKINLKNKIENLIDTISNLDKVQIVDLQSVEECKNNISELEYKKSEILKDLEKKTEKKSELNIRLQKTKDQLNWNKNQIMTFKNNQSSINDLIRRSDEETTSSQQLLVTLREKEAGYQNELSTFANSTILDTVHQLETSTAVAKQKILNVEERLKSLEETLTDDQNSMNSQKDRLSQVETSIGQITETISLNYAKEKALNQKIDSIKLEKQSPLEKELEEVQNLYDKKTRENEDNQKELSIIERQFAEIQLELTRKKEKLENLRDKIEDDFGFVEFEFQPDVEGPKPLPFKDMVIESLVVKNELPENTNETIQELKNQLRRIGAINPEAQQEYFEVKERYEFLSSQVKDLENATDNLQLVIKDLDEIMRNKFLSTFKEVSIEFSNMFSRLFNGGNARLTISDESDPISSGIDIEARLPGKREQGLVLLSGGERSLTAVALVFALLKVSPTPFCVLDEVDAMLDESNVGRFIELLQELSTETQFVLITHNRNTVQAADVIYGITMGRDISSQVISLRLDEVDSTYIE